MAKEPRRRALTLLVWIVLIALLISLRVWRLDTDAYRALSWDTGLFTDEGYYTHNARNVALFGTYRTDDFNNGLLMPTLHLVQVSVFRIFGMGAIQARLISVGFSLLTLSVFYAAMRRAFGAKAAALGTVFLGFDHVNLLYNRMALMDTPAAFLMVCIFYGYVRIPEARDREGVGRWSFGIGHLLGFLYATRGLALFLALPTLIAVRHDRNSGGLEQRRGLYSPPAAVLSGLLIMLLMYAVAWYIPNRAELTRINAYYVQHQLLPHTLLQLGLNIRQAFLGTRFPGLFPYLFAHTPVVTGLALLWLLAWPAVKTLPDASRRSVVFLAGWVVTAWGLYALVNYSPSRYYVLFYPALMGLAAAAIVHLPEISKFLLRGRTVNGTALAVVLVLVWANVNMGWLLDWAQHTQTTQRDADRWLAENLPANSVLFGDCAPGLCLNNRFMAVNVIPVLCNDNAPLERFADRPRFVAILDGPYKATNEKWWGEHYPNVMHLKNRVKLFDPLISHPVGIYKVDTADMRTGP